MVAAVTAVLYTARAGMVFKKLGPQVYSAISESPTVLGRCWKSVGNWFSNDDDLEDAFAGY